MSSSKNGLNKTGTRNFIILAMFMPIVLLIFIIYYPAVVTFFTSLTSKNLRLPGTQHFVFLKNYHTLLKTKEFWTVTLRTLVIVVFTLILEITIGFLIALLLNENFKGRGIVRTLVIIPWMLPPVVNGFLWNWVLNGEYGALNGLLYQLGIIHKYRFWLQNPNAQIFWVIIVQTWTRFAFPMIIMLAGLQSIPDELYEVASIDGAGPLDKLRFITLPMLLPSIAVSLTVEFIAAFQIFDVVWTLTAGGSAGNVINPFTKTLMIYNFQVVFRDMTLGLGSALAYIILIMSLAVGIFFIKILYERAVER